MEKMIIGKKYFIECVHNKSIKIQLGFGENNLYKGLYLKMNGEWIERIFEIQ